MNKSDLVTRMAERFGGDRATAVAAVNGVLEEIERGVARGDRVTLTGFGTFERRERASRTSRNPRTGEAIQVSASVVPVFRAGSAFRDVVSRSDDGSSPTQGAAVDGGVAATEEAGAAEVAPALLQLPVPVPVPVGDGAGVAGKNKKGKKKSLEAATPTTAGPGLAAGKAGKKGGKKAAKKGAEKAGKKARKASA